MFDIITIGGVTNDVFVEDKEFQILKKNNFKFLAVELGEKIIVDHIRFNLGGGGANTTVAFSKLGFKTSFCGMVGKDCEGHLIKKGLIKKNVNLDLFLMSEKYRTAFSIILYSKKERERTILLFRGASDYLTKSQVNWQKLRKTKWIYVSHLSGRSHELLDNLVRFKKQNPKIKVAWNPGSTQIEKGIKNLSPMLSNCDILFLNKKEAEELLRFPSLSESSKTLVNLTPLFKKLSLYGPKVIVVSCGRKGAQAWHKDKIYIQKAVDLGKVVDTVGAGDAFASAFVSGFIYHNNIDTALKFGVINGAAVTTKPGAQEGLLTKKEIEKRISKI